MRANTAPRTCLIVLGLLQVVLLQGHSEAATPADWLNATDGSWTEPSNWLTGVIPQNGLPDPADAYDAVIGATGLPYIVTTDSDLLVDSATLASPNATLQINDGVFTALNGLNIQAGQVIFSGGTIENTRIDGPGPLLITGSDTKVLKDVTLATTLAGGEYNSRNLQIQGDLELDGGEILIDLNNDSLLLRNNANVLGTGEIVFGERGGVLYLSGDEPVSIFGPGVDVRFLYERTNAAITFQSYTSTTSALLVNQGSIIADTPGSRLRLVTNFSGNSPGNGVVNQGLIAARNGATVEWRVPFGYPVGNVDIGPGSTMRIIGTNVSFDNNGNNIDQPITVPAGALLSLEGFWFNHSTITIDQGTLELRSDSNIPGTIQYNQATLLVGGPLDASFLTGLNTPADTTIGFTSSLYAYVNLEGQDFDLNSINSQWDLASARFRNGTLTGVPDGRLAPSGERVWLDDVTIGFDLTIDGGQVFIEGQTDNAGILSLTGGVLQLYEQWSNSGTIHVDGGSMNIRDPGVGLGSVILDSGELGIFTMLPASIILGVNASPAASVNFGGGYSARGIDLEGVAVDLSAVTATWDFNTARVINGTLTGASLLGQMPEPTDQATLVDVVLDFPLDVIRGRVQLTGTSVINQQVTVNGGELWLDDDWSNLGGIVVDDGILTLANIPTDLGTIQMNGGTLRFSLYTTLSEALALGVGTPQSVEAVWTGRIDFEGAVLDLGAASYDWRLAGGIFANGTITDSTGTHPLVSTNGGTLDAITVDVGVMEGSFTLTNGTNINGSRIGEPGSEATVSIYDARWDGVELNSQSELFTVLEVVNGLTLNGTISLAGPARNDPTIRFTGTQSVSGNGIIDTVGARSSFWGLRLLIDNGTLTLGEGITYHTNENDSVIEGTNGTLINHGEMVMEGILLGQRPDADLTLPISLLGLENHGRMLMREDAEVVINVEAWTNDGLIQLDDALVRMVGTSFDNSPTGRIEGRGTLDVSQSVFTNHGTVAPGLSPGVLVIEGDYTQADDGLLEIELGGPLAGSEYDVLHITGDVMLGGTLKISLIDGYVPSAGSFFGIITTDGGPVVGEFEHLEVYSPGYSLDIDLLYGSTVVIVEILGVLDVIAGDLDGDGFVGIADLNLILPAWNTSVTAGDLLAGDLSGDGFVGIEDLNIVLGNWNAGAPPSEVVIPEPASAGLILLGVMIGALKRARGCAIQA